jgi:hypothetical protein
MINIFQNGMSCWPQSFQLASNTATALPFLGQTFDYHRVSPTSAVGSIEGSICGAVGEYLERKHFYNEVAIDGYSEICNLEGLNNDSKHAFLRLIRQTMRKDLNSGSLKKHKFTTVTAFSVFDMKTVQIPAVMVSLSGRRGDLGNDKMYLPHLDTTGCSAHVNLEKATSSALNELIERQCLLSYWSTLKIKSCIDNITVSVNLSSYAKKIVNKLMLSGELKIYDITMDNCPGFAIICIYGSQNESHSVRYSTGMSFNEVFHVAIDKAIIELWQSFTLHHLFTIGGYTRDDIDDSYHKYYWDCNSYETYKLMTSVSLRINVSDIATYHSVKEYSLSLTKNLFYYIRSEVIGPSNVWYVRALSPDFYIHMDFSNPINFKNKISNLMRITTNERSNIMVPFP